MNMDGVADYFPSFSSRLNPNTAPPPPPPPPAPPLPPQKYSVRATNALSRVTQTLLGASRPSSAQAQRAEDISGRFAPTSVPRACPLSSQTTNHKTGIPIQCFDISPDRSCAILGGNHILKTIRIAGATCSEEFNLRAAISSYASTHTGGPVRSKDQFVTVDLKWSHGNFDTYILAAGSSGKMVVFDLNRPGVELIRLHEHPRQVHRIAINPHQGALCLTASSDTLVKLWDLRDMAGQRSVMNWNSKTSFRARADAVRDVKWSPTDGMEFACATDTGSVQRWDFRKDNACLVRHAAHNGRVLVVDYHPDGKHLASAGEDKNVKIWDILSVNRRQKPSWQLRAPQTVNKLAWRPAAWSNRPASTPGGGGWETTQILTGYRENDRRMHLWDLKRRFVPVQEIDRHSDVVTGMLWRSEDLLWSVGIDGTFVQTDIHFTPHPIERRSLMAFDWAPSGDIAFFGQKRHKRRVSGLEGAANIAKGVNRSGGSSGERSSGSRNTADFGGDDGFLSSSTRRLHARTPSLKSSKSISGYTPPSTNTPVLKLDELMAQSKKFDLKQIGAIAHVPGTFDEAVFKFLTERYKLSVLLDYPSNMRLDHRFKDATEWNACVAKYCGMYRLAQTWRAIGQAVCRELKVRASERRKARLEAEAERARGQEQMEERVTSEAEEKVLAVKAAIEKVRGMRIMTHLCVDGSGMATPLARPLPDSPQQSLDEIQLDVGQLDMSQEGESFTLPPAAWGRNSGNHPRTNSGSKASNVQCVEQANDTINTETSLENNHGIKPSVEGDPSSSRNGDSTSPTGDVESLRSLFPDYYGEDSIEDESGNRNGINYPLDDAFKLALRLETSHGPRVLAPKTDFPQSRLSRLGSTESLPMFSASIDGTMSGHSGSDPFRSDLPPAHEEREVPIEEAYHLPAHASDSSQGSYANPGFSETSSSMGSKVVPVGHIFASSRDSDSDPARLGKDDPMAASGTIVPDHDDECRRLGVSHRHFGNPDDVCEHWISPPLSPTVSLDDGFLVEDFVLEPAKLTDPSGPEFPWSAQSIIEETVEFYADAGDMQTAASIVLLTYPFYPPLENDRAEEILYLYIKQLVPHQLLVDTAFIRKLACRGGFGGIIDPAIRNHYFGFRCGHCEKPLENVRTKRSSWACEKCGNLQDGCIVCMERGHGRRWSWCQGCGHGGHDECIRAWFSDPAAEGCCPGSGCLHDCLPGKRREERILEDEEQERKKEAEKERQLKEWEARMGFARPDRKVAGESRAVGKTRGLLRGERDGVRDRLANGDDRGEKRVRVIEPGEEVVTPGEVTFLAARDVAGKVG
ncbi:MAG: SEA (Seh1-associated) complex subunit [Trichoglossum hirsutum]|nr:MAG: SEA (Seh1-associated) complex subunit [Trichoglossum hirsutum]